MRESNPPAEPATFEDLYADHERRVLSLLRRFGVAPSECEDVAQEVWIDVHRSLPLFSSSAGSARAWIAGIARNAALDWNRRRQRRPELWTHTDQEPSAPYTGETEMEEAQRRAALWSYFERVVPDKEQRDAWMLHVVDEMTIEEVAQVTKAKPSTVKWRIAMARSRLKEERSEEERRGLAAILPVLSEEALVKALRETKFSDDVSARVWERVKERIEAEGGSVHDPLGSPDTAPSPAAPKGYTFTRPGLASTLGGVFVAGALAGALAHAMFTSRNAPNASIDAESLPVPPPTAEPKPEPAPTASTAPSTSATASSGAAAAPRMSETWLLNRALMAVPSEALALAEQHARSFPGSARTLEREEIAIRALLQLGRRAEAEARASQLVRRAPKMRQAMEALCGRSLF